ncbi:hypothetical protein WG922_21470 [Ramlibacter sp. AN1015]|uniref:hypothetical protein n=1 Tax=Ramlibacter sp. AN1015 TaxID=3133428 RepID=UPI0030C2373D
MTHRTDEAQTPQGTGQMSSLPSCSSCKSWQPKQSGGMAKHRMAICERNPRWKFFPPQSSCPHFQAAPTDVVESRIVWLGAAR